MNRQTVTSIQSWLITLAILFFSFGSVVLALVCIFSTPDQVVRPFAGALFFWGGAVLLVVLLALKWKLDVNITPANQVVFRQNLSDNILKWVMTLYSGGFCMTGVLIALICIFSLPNQAVEVNTSLLYFAASACVVIGVVIAVWRSTVSRRL